MAPVKKPILIISLPRSGSTWTLNILGAAPGSLPIFEPFLSEYKRINGSWCWFSKDPKNDAVLASMMHNAAHGLPLFEPIRLLQKQRWGISRPAGMQPVLKEVSLRLAPIFIDRYQPKVLFLRRHPAAVAESLIRTGVLGVERLDSGMRHPVFSQFFQEAPLFQALGKLQSFLLSEFYTYIKSYKDCIAVSHEDLCLNPVGAFREIYDFCALRWHLGIEDKIAALKAENSENPFLPVRYSETLPSQIAKRLSSTEVALVRKGWSEHEVPWYRSDQEWQFD